MYPLAGRIAAIVLLLAFASPAFAWRPRFHICESELRSLEFGVRETQLYGGSVPDHDGLPAFMYERDADLIPRFFEGSFEGGCASDGWPLDPWGNRYIYTPPPQGSSADPDPLRQPLFRSIGANGIDDHGSGDDLVFGSPIRPGHYWKRRWPLIPWYLGAFSIGWLLLLACFRIIPSRWRRHFWPVNTAYVAIASIVTLPLMLSPWVVRGTFHTELGTAWNIAWAMLLASVAWLFLSTVWQRWDYSPGFCTGCRYSLKGLPPEASKCPECGRPVPNSIPSESDSASSAPPR